MTSFDDGIGRLRAAAGRVTSAASATARVVGDGRSSHHEAMGSLHALAQIGDAEGALCPRAADHHRADGGAAIGGRFHVHGAALDPGDEVSVVGGDAGDRHPDRRLQDLSAGRRPRPIAPHRAGPARPRGRFPAQVGAAAARPEAVLLAARSRRFRKKSASRSVCRSGSTPSAAPRSWKSASSSTTRSCACSRGAPTSTILIHGSSCFGWWRPRWSCSPSPSCSCATRSGRSCGLPMPPKRSARAAKRPISGRAARAKSAAPPPPSWK